MKKMVILSLMPVWLFARVLLVGPEGDYPNLQPAAERALPGDTIWVQAGVYDGDQYIVNLQGNPDEWITILSEEVESSVVRGGGEAWHLIDAAYLRVSGFIFEQQSDNGVNADDGGDYRSPAHHLAFDRCTFRDMESDDNSDLLKLSGVDSFEVTNCTFFNGSPGGSGIDMVGCHQGIISGNRFENMGTNSIQAKGGSQHIRIERNLFKNGGDRSLNLGGSTDLEFFRPVDAPFEAADLEVYANLFIGSEAPIAYVGCIRTAVVNNTIFEPGNWVVRILQETVDPSRFASCGDNRFVNNIVYQGNLSTETNIGPDTRPESFVFTDNLWYNREDGGWSGPSIPADDPGMIVGLDPLFIDPENENFSIDPSSPAIGKGADVQEPGLDYFGRPFNEPRSIGAVEGSPANTSASGTAGSGPDSFVFFPNYPNPFNASTTVSYLLAQDDFVEVLMFGADGTLIQKVAFGWQKKGCHRIQWDAGSWSSGLYFCRVKTSKKTAVQKCLYVK